MKLSELSVAAIAKIKQYRWDRIIEKHEGPERWESILAYDDPEFLEIGGHSVLLPLNREHHANITILRVIMSDDTQVMTIFLRDTTWYDDPSFSGFLAICEKVSGESFYLATVYHEWFIFENPE